jgi:hypothetical protein
VEAAVVCRFALALEAFTVLDTPTVRGHSNQPGANE